MILIVKQNQRSKGSTTPLRSGTLSDAALSPRSKPFVETSNQKRKSNLTAPTASGAIAATRLARKNRAARHHYAILGE
jgi:hypothetical protein